MIIIPEVGKYYHTHVKDLIRIDKIDEEQVKVYNYNTSSNQFIRRDRLVLRDEVKRSGPGEKIKDLNKTIF